MRISSAPTDAEVAAVDLTRVDLFDPGLYGSGEPHPIWAAMRRHAPLHRQVLPDGRAFWSVTRYDDVCRVLGNHREFTSERGSLLTQLGHPDSASGKMLVATDPPRHTELRRPLSRLFNGRALAGTRDRIQQAVLVTLAPAVDGGEWDIAARATRLPMAVAAALMDTPECDWANLVRWTGAAAAPSDPQFAVGGPDASLAAAHRKLIEYFTRQARDREGTDGDDLIRHLMTMPAGGDRLTRHEVVVNCYSVLLGANATTPHTIAGTVQALAERPTQYRRLRDNPDLVPSLVEEGLRWTSAANSFLRHATRRVELSGGAVEEGDAVVAWVGSANRDSAVFADPYHFDLARTKNPHVAFGFGPHYCIGAAVARLTLGLFFTEFIRLVAQVAPAGPATHLVSNFVAGFAHLPVRTSPTTSADSEAVTSRREGVR
jgi:cytochrome P450